MSVSGIQIVLRSVIVFVLGIVAIVAIAAGFLRVPVVENSSQNAGAILGEAAAGAARSTGAMTGLLVGAFLVILASSLASSLALAPSPRRSPVQG